MDNQSLDSLIENLSPRLNDGHFVFCNDAARLANDAAVVARFEEREGTTVVLAHDDAVRLGLSFDSVMAWITLDVQSSLQAVGLTACVSTALARANIACNVMAGYHHDHLFVPIKDAQQAMEILNKLSDSTQ